MTILSLLTVMATFQEMMIKVYHVTMQGSDYEFEVVWPSGRKSRYLVNPYLGKQYKKMAKYKPGKVANLLKTNGVLTYQEEIIMNAEKLIDQYIEEQGDKAMGKGPYGKPAKTDGNKGKPATHLKPDGTSSQNKVS